MKYHNNSIQDEALDGLKRTIYVFVRTDIAVEHQIVQAAHAAAESARRYYAREHGIASLIVLAVPNLTGLYKARTQLEALAIEHTMFFEPDGDMGDSSAATRPLLAGEREQLRGWRLWRLKPNMARATVGAAA